MELSEIFIIIPTILAPRPIISPRDSLPGSSSAMRKHAKPNCPGQKVGRFCEGGKRSATMLEGVTLQHVNKLHWRQAGNFGLILWLLLMTATWSAKLWTVLSHDF